MNGLFRNIFTVMTPRQQRERRDHLIVIASGALNRPGFRGGPLG